MDCISFEFFQIAYEGSEISVNNFGKFIYRLQSKTKTLVRKLERILIKLYRQNMSLLFNQTCLNEGLLPNYIYFNTHTHTYIYIYIYTYIYIYIYIYIPAYWHNEFSVRKQSGRLGFNLRSSHNVV